MAIGGWDVGVRISTDGGATWTDRSAGLPVKHVFVLAFDPDTPGRLWASTFEEGAFFSDDHGQTCRTAASMAPTVSTTSSFPPPRHP